jgi:hypothetical protein
LEYDYAYFLLSDEEKKDKESRFIAKKLLKAWLFDSVMEDMKMEEKKYK